MFLGRTIWPLVESRVISIGKTPVRLCHMAGRGWVAETSMTMTGRPVERKTRNPALLTLFAVFTHRSSTNCSTVRPASFRICRKVPGRTRM
jgi:hypothetical protein